MALRNAILASLLDGGASGYDLAKSFDGSVAAFWTATPQQLYRELDRLESQGLVTAQLVEQPPRPNKRIFSLTAEGRAALREFTGATPRPTAVRDELLIQVTAVDQADPAGVRRAVSARMVAARSRLGHYRATRTRMLKGRTEAEFLARARRIGPYLTLLRGISFEEDNIAWCEHALAALAARFGE